MTGIVQQVAFHPTKPILFVAVSLCSIFLLLSEIFVLFWYCQKNLQTQRYVKVYDLVKQLLVKKLMTNVKYVSSMDVHPGGDNIIIGSYDSRLSWFDLDLSTKPYKTLK